MQDIKTEPITAKQLEEMKKLAGSYEALFSRRALKYRELGLKDKSLSEKDYKKLILEESIEGVQEPQAVLAEKETVANKVQLHVAFSRIKIQHGQESTVSRFQLFF